MADIDIPEALIWIAFALWSGAIGFVVGVYCGVKFTEQIVDEIP